MNANELYKDLKSRIIGGELKAGQNLAETVISTEYGVSRLYVKHALQQLAAEQIVSHYRNRGYFVNEIPDSVFAEISDLRLSLEWLIIKRTIEVATDDQFEELTKLFNRISVFMTNDMFDDGLKEVDAFYKLLYNTSGYTRVAAILDTYNDYIKILRKQSANTKEEHMESLEAMRKLLSAMKARDFEKAYKCIEARSDSAFIV